MMPHILLHGNMVYVTSIPITQLIYKDFFQVVYKDFALDLARQGANFINHKKLDIKTCGIVLLGMTHD